MKGFWLAVVVSGMWMNLSEFIRNEFVIKHVWVKGFEEIGLSFPLAPVNGFVWVIWTFIFCAVLTALNMRFNALRSTIICWVTGFGLLWIAMWNIGILPKGLFIGQCLGVSLGFTMRHTSASGLWQTRITNLCFKSRHVT